MTEQVQRSGSGAGGSPVVLVEQSAASRHMQSFRTNDMQEEPKEVHHTRSKAPAVPTAVTDDLKDSSITSKEKKESDRAISSEKHVSKKKSSSTKRRASSPESIKMSPIETEPKRSGTSTSPQPIPAQLSAKDIDKAATERNENLDGSITEDDVEKRPLGGTSKDSVEAMGGLARSESRASRASHASRASRVSRAMRQFLCCGGVRVDAPSEHDVSPRRYHAI